MDFDPPIACEDCVAWNEAQAPFRVWGETYFVGTKGISSVVVHTSAGLVLFDAALPQSAPQIEDNLRALGFSVDQVKLIGVSHTHYDHVGGIAALQRHSGADVVASPAAVAALFAGHPNDDDPQKRDDVAFPPVAGARAIADEEAITVGDTTFVAHFTPGHTPGGTTWTWKSCAGDRCVDVVYGDSLNAVSSDAFRFDAGAGDVLAASIDKVAALPCDVLVAVHPYQSGTLEAAASTDPDAFVDPSACRVYAKHARHLLRRRLHDERRGR